LPNLSVDLDPDNFTAAGHVTLIARGSTNGKRGRRDFTYNEKREKSPQARHRGKGMLNIESMVDL